MRDGEIKSKGFASMDATDTMDRIGMMAFKLLDTDDLKEVERNAISRRHMIHTFLSLLKKGNDVKNKVN